MLSRHLVWLSVLLPGLAAAQQADDPAAAPKAVIQVLEGDGAINSIRLHRGHNPAVRVVTAAGEPIAGATVTFVLPATGPSATFANSGLSVSAVTNERGIAIGLGLRPNSVAGPFQIRATTSWHGSPAVAVLAQTNAEPVVRSSHTKTIVILGAIAGAAAVGAGVVLSHQSASSAQGAAVPSGGSISAGSPSIGPPH